MTDRSTYSTSAPTGVYLMQLFGRQAKEHLSLCDTDVTAHDDSVYSEVGWGGWDGMERGGRRDVYI